jgi:uncharacterized protein YoxC
MNTLLVLKYVFAGALVAGVILLIMSLIWLIVKLARTLSSLRAFLRTASEALEGITPEVKLCLEGIRRVTDNMDVLTKDITVLSGAVRNVGENVQQVSGNVRRLRDFAQDIGNHASSAMSSLEAGFKTGFGVLLKNLFRGGARPNILPHFDKQRR